EGNNIEAVVTLTRDADRQPVGMEFKPGQGVDDASGAVIIPAAARIVKIILNVGRIAVPGEEVVRYFVAGAGEAEAGVKPDPKNVIAPLGAPFADPADKAGARA